MPEDNQKDCRQITEDYDSKSGGIISSRPPVPKKLEISSGIMEMDAQEIKEQKKREEERKKRQAEEEKNKRAEARRKKQAEKAAEERRQREEEQKKISDEWKRIEEAQAKIEKEKKRIASERSDLDWERRRLREERERKEREEREQEEREERERQERRGKREREYNAACKKLNELESYGYTSGTFRALNNRFADLGDYKDSALKQKICAETANAIKRYDDRQKGWCIVTAIFTIILIICLVYFHINIPLPVGWTKYLMFAGEVLVAAVLTERIGDTADNDIAAFLMYLPVIYPLFYTFYLFPSAAINAGMGWVGVIISSLVPTLIGYVIGAVVLGSMVVYYEGAELRIYKKIKRKYTE